MKKLLLLLTMTAVCLPTARAAISVGAGGSGVLAFNTAPAATEFSTGVLNGDGTTFANTTALDAGVQTVSAANIVRTLPTSATQPPSTFSGGFRYNTAGLFIQSRPTTDGTNAANVMLATLQNDSGAPITAITVSYTFGINNSVAGELPGFRVYYSLSGAAGTWTLIPALSDSEVAGTQSSGAIAIGSWASGSTMYLLWADDNANGVTDPSYTIDDFSVTIGGGSVPLSVNLTSPTNGTLVVAPANVIVSATSGGTTPATSVSFYTNNVLFFTDTTAPYSNELVNLPVGTYAVYAQAVNGSETAYSATNTVTVRPEFVSYAGGTITESFDGMGTAGTTTPTGWYVGAALPANTMTVTVGDGSAGANGAILGWNYGTTGDGDRALGTAPTGADRNMVVRIQNTTISNIVSFTFHFDGEVWRNYTNENDGWLTNYVSFDLGTTWIPTGFDFEEPAALRVQPQGAVLGNDTANRVAGLGGTITPPSPISPGEVIYIRWQDFNGVGVTDGGLAIDNFSFAGAQFSSGTLDVTIISPTNGQVIAGACAGANVTVNATASLFVTNVAFSLDGGAVVNDSTSPYSTTFSTVPAGSHTVRAVGTDSQAGAKVTNDVTFTVSANIPPTVAFTNVFSGSTTGLTFLVGTPVTNQFGVTDPDGTIASIEFQLNGLSLFVTNVSYGQFIVNDLLAGTNTFTVRATDNCGSIGVASQLVVGTNPPSPISVIVSNASSWKYEGTGAAPANDIGGHAWYESAFDDSTWASGFAELGNGDAVSPPNTNPERTKIDIGPSGNRYHAVYFRKTFVVANPSDFTGLIVRALNDDGSAIYLNGTLVATFHMTNDVTVPFTYADFAGPGAIGDDGTIYYSSNIVNTLVAGNNTLAVEVHQDAIGSSDLSFDLMLWGIGSGNTGPRLTIQQIDATHVTVSWPIGSAALLYFTTNLNAPQSWSLETGLDVPSGGFHHVTVSTAGGPKFWTLRQ